jgi:hypothetical protein
MGLFSKKTPAAAAAAKQEAELTAPGKPSSRGRPVASSHDIPAVSDHQGRTVNTQPQAFLYSCSDLRSTLGNKL